MWLVAGDALGSARMLLGIHLRELFGLGLLLAVATLAETGPGQFLRLDLGRIVGVLGVRPVAGLARNSVMFALGSKGSDLVVARGTSRLAGERNRPGPYVVKGCGPVMAIAPEGLRDQDLAQEQKDKQARAEDQDKRNQVGGFLEAAAHVLPPPLRKATEVRKNSTTYLISDITLCL
jgi:hypothetical protein